MSTLLHVATLVSSVLVDAEDKIDPEIEKKLTPGWTGAIVILGLIAVTVLLWLSMRRQFRKIRFEDDAARDRTTDEDGRNGTTAGEDRDDRP